MLNDTVCLNRRRKSRRRTFEASPFKRLKAGQVNSINVRLAHFKRVHPCENCNVMFNEKGLVYYCGSRRDLKHELYPLSNNFKTRHPSHPT